MNDSEKPYFPHLWQNRIPHDKALTIAVERAERGLINVVLLALFISAECCRIGDCEEIY